MKPIITTNRLALRNWKESDLQPFAELNADPRVREFFPGLLTPEESNKSVEMMKKNSDDYGFCLWAASLLETDEFIGFIGLQKVPYNAPFTPAVEIGWRLGFKHWGKGYATEGALACLEYGFETLKLPEIVSFTTTQNLRSRNVMEKIGMHRDPQDDFNHPLLSLDHPLSAHVLYRLKRQEWLK